MLTNDLGHIMRIYTHTQKEGEVNIKKNVTLSSGSYVKIYSELKIAKGIVQYSADSCYSFQEYVYIFFPGRLVPLSLET